MLYSGDGLEGREAPETAALNAKLGLDKRQVFLMPGETPEEAVAAVRAAVQESGDLDKVLEERRVSALAASAPLANENQ